MMRSRLLRSIKRNVMLTQQFLPAIRPVSNEFFQQDSVPAHRALEAAVNFFLITLPNIKLFQKSSLNRLSGEFVIKYWSNVPQHLSHVATLRCDVSLMFQSRLFVFLTLIFHKVV